MRRRQIIFFALLLLLAAGVLFVVTRTRRAPFLPADGDHRAFISGESCNDCHGSSADFPRGPNHPVGMDCMRCHAHR